MRTLDAAHMGRVMERLGRRLLTYDMGPLGDHHEDVTHHVHDGFGGLPLPLPDPPDPHTGAVKCGTCGGYRDPQDPSVLLTCVENCTCDRRAFLVNIRDCGAHA